MSFDIHRLKSHLMLVLLLYRCEIIPVPSFGPLQPNTSTKSHIPVRIHPSTVALTGEDFLAGKKTCIGVLDRTTTTGKSTRIGMKDWGGNRMRKHNRSKWTPCLLFLLVRYVARHEVSLHSPFM